MYIRNETPLTLNPFLAEAVNASRRGVQVRVLLDSSWYDTEGQKTTTRWSRSSTGSGRMSISLLRHGVQISAQPDHDDP